MMKNIHRGTNVLLSLVAVLCLIIKGFGQSNYEMETILAQDKYYSGLNAYIFNASTRDATKRELKSVFRDDGVESIVQKDLNLIDGKSISAQTNLDEYLTALGFYANRSMNERTIFKIESKLVPNSYSESSKYVSYLGRSVVLSTIDVNKTIIYGRKHIQVKDHITLYDGLIEKIESETQSQKPPRPSPDDGYKGNGYMDIVEISFGNTDYNNNIINEYGAILYDCDIRYITPKIKYNGLVSESKTVELKAKIIRPDGSFYHNKDTSPSGFTQSFSMKVLPGNNNSYTPSGWGNKQKSAYRPGTYRYELWNGDSKLYSATFVIKAKNALSKGEWRTSMKKTVDNVTDKLDNGTYKGQKDNGQRNGLGVYWWNDGDFHWGGYSNGKRNGDGLYIINNGEIKNCSDCVYYVGNWQNGDKSGNGTCYDRYGNLIYYGNFSNDAPTGTYPMTGSGYSSYKFECIEYDNGNKYVGETYMGKRHGYGIYLWKNGDAWYGPWEDGSRKGYGIDLYYNGGIKSGYWTGDTYSSY